MISDWLNNFFQSYLWLRVGMHLFVGFIIALLFNKMGYDASKTIFNFGYCYACTIAMLYIPMMPVLLACKYNDFIICRFQYYYYLLTFFFILWYWHFITRFVNHIFFFEILKYYLDLLSRELNTFLYEYLHNSKAKIIYLTWINTHVLHYN